MTYKRLGDLLLNIGLISQEQLEQALSIQRTTKKRLGTVLVDSGFITEQQLIEALELQLGIEFIDLSKAVIPTDMAQLLSKNIAKKYNVVPVRSERDTLYLAMSDPLNFMAIEEVKTATRKKVVPMIATAEAVDRAIITLYGNEGAARAIEEMRREARPTGDSVSVYATTAVDEDVQSAPTVRLVNSIIGRAVAEQASDIHLEPHEDELRVRMRIDGMMRNVLTVPKDLQASVISRLKVMGGMDIAERKVPQDGRANVQVKHTDVDLRMSTLPTIHGEKLVIRLLDKNAQLLDKKAIGLTGGDLEKYEALVHTQSGVVLIVGPTGSGKSSTMYTMLRELNTEQVNLVTLEDPVEYHLDGINQVQINEKTGMTFSGGLRAILRQDPDIIGVGEIRDGETASIAMRAAITGHLVLSTIHTSSAAAAVDRLLDIGVEPYLIAAALRGIISQRLVRRICPHCRQEYTPGPGELEELGLDHAAGQTFYRGAGCPSCFHTGYRGRTGVFEILTMDRQLRRAITGGADRDLLQQLLGKANFVSLADNCRRLVLEGVTTLEEARRAINSADL
ncbi:GspE/PulE family protein [uncultured Oscillibacter sp.]|uniref:GspE/PulE family protein n=1 Tax=uncultured Oscillibacter sp. TaxID=876091 RepID=UPI0025DFED2C|nr:GspE/PulE family protein [uncultured Oscillibacter sp.]